MLEGRLAMGEGAPGRGCEARLATAADVQEQETTELHGSAEWWYPVRRSAAAAWLKAGDVRQGGSRSGRIAENLEERPAGDVGARHTPGLARVRFPKGKRCLPAPDAMARQLRQHNRRSDLTISAAPDLLFTKSRAPSP